MSGSFDPYHKWLGISPKDQPPHHYRLLGIDLFESDPDVISSAADQRMGHVRVFQTGKHSALSQQILNEIAGARVCLLSPEKKAEYDRRLRAQLGVAGAPAGPTGTLVATASQPSVLPPLPPATPPLDEPVPPRFEGPLPSQRLRRRKLPWQALTAILVATAIFVGAWIALTHPDGPKQAAGPDPEPRPSTKPDPSEPPPPDPKPDEPSPTHNAPSVAGEDSENTTNVPAEKAASSPPPGRPQPPKPKAGEPPGRVEPGTSTGSGTDTGNIPAVGKPAEDLPDRVPLPDAAAQAGAQARLEQTLASAPAAELLNSARADGRPADECFVLLEKARDVAAAGEDVDTALAATDELVRRYEVDALEVQVETFGKLRESVATPSVARALAEKGFALVDDAAGAGNKPLALQVAEDAIAVARKSDDNELFRQAVVRFVNLRESP